CLCHADYRGAVGDVLPRSGQTPGHRSSGRNGGVRERGLRPTPVSPFRLYGIATKQSPVAAYVYQGNVILPRIRRREGIYVVTFHMMAYHVYHEVHISLLDLGDLPQPPRILLFLHGWLPPFDSSLNLAVSQRENMVFRFPSLHGIGEDGQWHTAIANIGAPA